MTYYEPFSSMKNPHKTNVFVIIKAKISTSNSQSQFEAVFLSSLILGLLSCCHSHQVTNWLTKCFELQLGISMMIFFFVWAVNIIFHGWQKNHEASFQRSICKLLFIYMWHSCWTPLHVYTGTWTPLHADVFRSYSWSANVCGKKRWLFLPPSQSHLLFDRQDNNVLH